MDHHIVNKRPGIYAGSASQGIRVLVARRIRSEDCDRITASILDRISDDLLAGQDPTPSYLRSVVLEVCGEYKTSLGPSFRDREGHPVAGTLSFGTDQEVFYKLHPGEIEALRAFYVAGEPPEQICASSGLSRADFIDLKAWMKAAMIRTRGNATRTRMELGPQIVRNVAVPLK